MHIVHRAIPPIRELLRALIESRGWSVCGIAKDGQEAVEKATALKPDLVIVDLAMPVLNGLLAAREISSKFPTIPILLHTIHDHPQVVDEARKYGIREVVGKNEGGEKILGAIEKHLNARPQGVAHILSEIESSNAEPPRTDKQKLRKPD